MRCDGSKETSFIRTDYNNRRMSTVLQSGREAGSNTNERAWTISGSSVQPLHELE
jgi:hypothetical protein